MLCTIYTHFCGYNNKGPIYSSRLCHCANKMEFIVNSFCYYHSIHTHTYAHPIQIVFFAVTTIYIIPTMCASLGFGQFLTASQFIFMVVFFTSLLLLLLQFVCLFLRVCACSTLTLFMIFFLQCFALTIHLNEIFHQYSDANESQSLGHNDVQVCSIFAFCLYLGHLTGGIR